MTVARPLTRRIYDLAGDLVHAPPPKFSTSGRHRQRWNGRDDTGLPVPPGLYLYELTLESGEHSEHRVGSLAVAY